MKSTLTAIIAGAMLAVTGAIPASAFAGHTHTLNVAESGSNSLISQQQNTMLLAAKVGKSTTKSRPTTGGRKPRLKNAASAAEMANHLDQIRNRHKGN